jgi:hypothetical protein
VSLSAAVTVTVVPNQDRRPINPLIYGVSAADTARMTVVPYPLNRWGGNSVTRYNWKVDVHNTASDWFFMNVPDGNPNLNNLPNGTSADAFVQQTLARGSQPLLTVPLIGYTPKYLGITAANARGKRWGFGVAKYGAQNENECTRACQFDPNCMAWCKTDAGNGSCSSGTNCTNGQITGNDTADTSDPIDATFVTDWMTHIAGVLGGSGRLSFYALDNEPMLWNSTHRDVHPAPLTYDELWSRTVTYAAAIKARDATAKTFGPVEWGWCAYFTSAADAAVGPSCVTGADRQAHGGKPLLQWYLDQVCAYQQTNGVRLVDYLDIHYYPQGGGIAFGGDGAAAARMRSLKELYDRNWISESWIGQSGEPPMYVIPRMKEWIAGHCPGVGLAITEYNFGDAGPSSALAQAESLALFGREGVDAAARWVAPGADTLVEDAFKLYLNYDGVGAKVLGDSVRANTSTTPDTLGAYAVRGDGKLWVLLFNHTNAAQTVNVAFGMPVTGPAALWRFDSTHRLGSGGSATVTSGAISVTVGNYGAMLAAVQIPPSLIFADGFESGGAGAWAP